MFEERALRSRWSVRHIADKLVLVAAGLWAALMVHRLGSACVLAGGWLIWNLLAHGHRPGAVLRIYLAPALFLLPATFLVGLSIGPASAISDVVWSMPLPWGWAVAIGRGSVAVAALLVARALAAYGALVFLALSTPVMELTSALGRVGLPPVVLELVIFTYRMFGLLGESAERILRAQQARVGYRDRRRARRSVMLLVPAVVVGALHGIRRLGSALEARGYRGEMRVLLPLRAFRPGHFVGALAAAASLVLVVAWIDQLGGY